MFRNIVVVLALVVLTSACNKSAGSPMGPSPTPPPPGSQDNVPSADCPNEEYNVDGLVHLKVLVKPQCGSTIKVNAIPNIRIQMEQDAVPVGWFVFGLSQDPIGTPLDQITPFTGNDWPWDNLATVDSGLPRGQTAIADLSRILSPGLSASQKPRITYLLVTLRPTYSGLFWTGVNACHAAPGALCSLWQQVIKLDTPIVD